MAWCYREPHKKATISKMRWSLYKLLGMKTIYGVPDSKIWAIYLENKSKIEAAKKELKAQNILQSFMG